MDGGGLTRDGDLMKFPLTSHLTSVLCTIIAIVEKRTVLNLTFAANARANIERMDVGKGPVNHERQWNSPGKETS